MKILKITLQNINSLKSAKPTVIDFETEQFKDVGLYAITGVTGAGKTTILDAITIALYHSVPRFNGSKGTLFDVISHGANDAFSCVTFENNNFIYEGYWGVRLANKTGVILKNPIEIVHLKNISTGEILATQKRKYLEEIEKVTQLDYTQFLRSVLLAQGEFASFLSAKGPEKGKLLEQITGEKIYKKIGEEILNRKSKEEKKLLLIQAKINADDILSKENKAIFLEKLAILKTKIHKNEDKITKNTAIINWYIAYQKLLKKDETLEKDTQNLMLFTDNYKQELSLLSLHEKAIPFVEFLQNFEEYEKNILDKTAQEKILDDYLKTLIPKIENLAIQIKNETTTLENTEKEFAIWLSKLDEITKLDAQIVTEIDISHKLSEKSQLLKTEITTFEDKKNKLKYDLEKIRKSIKINQQKLTENKNLLVIKNHISSWNSSLTTLKTRKETLKKNILYVSEKNEILIKTKTFLKEKNFLLSQENIKIERIEKEISAINILLSKNNIVDLLANQKELSLAENNWKEFKNLSEEIKKNQQEYHQKIAQRNTFLSDLIHCKENIKIHKNNILEQEVAIRDAEKILNLEKNIINYEAERKKLKKGKPCVLCGSKVHPFTDKIAVISLSESEKILSERKNILKKTEKSKLDLKIKETTLDTNIQALEIQINSILETSKKLKLKVGELPISCDLDDTSKIEIELNSIEKKRKILANNLKATEKIQTEKDVLFKNIELKKDEINTLKTDIARLNEKIENTTKEIVFNQKETNNLRLICKDLEQHLKTKLAEFEYELPTMNQVDSFVQNVEKSISKYLIIQQDSQQLLSEEKAIIIAIENTKKQVENHTKTQNEHLKTIQKSQKNTKLLKKERETILPLEITVENKRKDLQFIGKNIFEKLEISKKAYQKLVEEKSTKEALKIKNKEDIKELSLKIRSLEIDFHKQLKNSDFDSKTAVKNVLLSKENTLKFITIKEQIDRKRVELKTLKESNLETKNTLLKLRNFEISQKDCQLKLVKLQQKNKEYLTQKGELTEALRKDKEIEDRNQEVYKKIDAQTKICTVWKELFKIIGNSKDAFNIYVQRLTLKHLLDLANIHLYKLNKRYSLKMEDSYRPKEELNFNLIDHYQTNKTRLVDTSSGGEKFIISLSLALGLSDLASKNVKINSLFIDEGFGTLDSNTLEIVISTLETLQAQGKMIGIISHVENLKERISTQIQITKKSNGVSVVNVV